MLYINYGALYEANGGLFSVKLNADVHSFVEAVVHLAEALLLGQRWETLFCQLSCRSCQACVKRLNVSGLFKVRLSLEQQSGAVSEIVTADAHSLPSVPSQQQQQQQQLNDN